MPSANRTGPGEASTPPSSTARTSMSAGPAATTSAENDTVTQPGPEPPWVNDNPLSRTAEKLARALVCGLAAVVAMVLLNWAGHGRDRRRRPGRAAPGEGRQ